MNSNFYTQKKANPFLMGIAFLFLTIFAWSHQELPANAEEQLNSTEKQTIISEQKMEEIQKLVEKTAKKAKLPSLSLAMTCDGKTSYLSYGNDTDNKEVVDEFSTFQIGSLSKSFTGIGILYLEKEGKISLQDPVSKYLPWFEVYWNGTKAELTIEQLLCQTSGFTNSEKEYPSARGGMTLQEGIELLNRRELSSEPGREFHYSNANYNILGLIIEEITEMSYSEYMEKSVFEPNGLLNTHCVNQESSQEEQNVIGQRLTYGLCWDYPLPVSDGKVPAGYLVSNVTEMAKWLEVTKEFWKDYPVKSKGLVDDHSVYFAGWYFAEDGRMYHSGGTPNYSARMILDSQKGISVVLLTNRNVAAATDDLAENIYRIIKGDQITEYRADVWNVFDLIYTIITIVGLLGIVITILLRKKQNSMMIDIILGVTLLVLEIIQIVVIPMIFQADWKEVMVWAPYSIPGGMITIAIWILTINAKILDIRRSR